MWWLILVAGNNLLLGANHKSLVTQNCEYKSTLPKTIDEFFTCGDGVPKFNAHKLNITNKKKKKKITNWITKLIWVMTFLTKIIYEQQWKSKCDC